MGDALARALLAVCATGAEELSSKGARQHRKEKGDGREAEGAEHGSEEEYGGEGETVES